MSSGKTIKLFLADGTSGGLITAEVLNWTGHVVMSPRSNLAELLKRQEVNRTGIYVLIGDDPDILGGTLSYVGEADDIGRRLYQHARSENMGGKDFWDRVVVVTSKDFNLTKAHARWLESRLIELAQEAKRTRIVNGTNPPLIQLPEADTSDMEYFVNQIKLVFPVLGENLFRSSFSVQVQAASETGTLIDNQVPTFELFQANESIRATAREVDGEFTVLAGSKSRLTWIGSDGGYKQLHEQLLQNGTLVREREELLATFSHDYAFSAPSAAAAVVLGRQANGRTSWKVQGTSTTFGEWQQRNINAVESDSSVDVVNPA